MNSNSCGDVLPPARARDGCRVWRAVSLTQEEWVYMWPVPAQTGQGRDRGSAVDVTMV